MITLIGFSTPELNRNPLPLPLPCALPGFQSGVLCNFFQVFYELEIVTEDTYYMWRDDEYAAQWGKDEALKEVQSFLSFLENGEEGEMADAESEEEGHVAGPNPEASGGHANPNKS